MKKKINIPKYAYGVDQITDAIGAGLNMIGNATQGNQVTASGVLSGVAGGAMAGAQFGVPGAIIGGGLGLLTSTMGTGGDVNEQTGEVTNPSGIAGLFGHSKRYLQNRGAKIRNGIQARSNAEQIASDYYMNNGYNNLSLSKGGVVPSTMAYLDDGELIRTPDGTIGSIPEEGKPTDSNLLNVPVGTQVLSDKIKVPGTNKTFAEMGKKLMKKTKYGGDTYAQNSKMLNEQNNQAAYQQLLQLQESIKDKKVKDRINKYDKGTWYIDNTLPIPALDLIPQQKQISATPNMQPIATNRATSSSKTTRVAPRISTYKYNSNMSAFPYWDKNTNNYTPEYLNWVNNITDADIKDIYNGKYGDMSTYLGKNKGVIPTVQEAKALMTDKKYGDWHKIGQTFATAKSRESQSIPNKTRFGRNTQDFSRTPITVNAPIGNVDSSNERGSYFNYTGNPGKINVNRKLTPSSVGEQNAVSPTNLEGLMSNLAALAGPIGNISVGRPEQVDTYTYDPVYGPTEYNIDPLLNQIASSDAIARYNMANVNPNTGANMAFGIQSAVNRNNAIANAYSQKNNAESQMAFNNAQIANQWGQQYANARHIAANEQAQNDATARNIRRQGYGDLSTRLQAINRDKRLMNRDQAMLEAMLPYLEYGMTSKQLKELHSRLSYGS